MNNRRTVLQNRKYYANALRELVGTHKETLNHKEAPSIIELLNHYADLLERGEVHPLTPVHGYLRTRTDSLATSYELRTRNKNIRKELQNLAKLVKKDNDENDRELKGFAFLIERTVIVMGISETRITKLPCEGIDKITFVSLLRWVVNNPRHSFFEQRRERIAHGGKWA